MKEKKKKDQEIKEVVEESKVKALTAAEYWEWRCAISDMSIAKKELEIGQMRYNEFKKDIELLSLRAKVYELTQMETLKANAKQASEAYEENKKMLETVHNTSLSGKIIDEVTYEIKELEN